MTHALVPFLGLVLAAGAPTPTPLSGRPQPAPPAAASIVPPPPTVTRARPAPATAAGKPIPRAPPAVPIPRAVNDAEDRERLVEQKCGRCHGVSSAWSRMSEAQWKAHMKRAALTDEQARKIRAALEARGARAASR